MFRKFINSNFYPKLNSNFYTRLNSKFFSCHSYCNYNANKIETDNEIKLGLKFFQAVVSGVCIWTSIKDLDKKESIKTKNESIRKIHLVLMIVFPIRYFIVKNLF
jgi:hypothetical protein